MSTIIFKFCRLMSKPINVEAQRVFKILNETVGKFSLLLNSLEKLKVLSLLNSEFFDEVFKKEEEDLSKLQLHFIPLLGQLFGPTVG